MEREGRRKEIASFVHARIEEEEKDHCLCPKCRYKGDGGAFSFQMTASLFPCLPSCLPVPFFP